MGGEVDEAMRRQMQTRAIDGRNSAIRPNRGAIISQKANVRQVVSESSCELVTKDRLRTVATREDGSSECV